MIKYEHSVKVYYRDVDQMGIAYYSRYLEYFEEARTELLNNIGLEISSIEERDIQIPVIISHCEYKKGAELEQTLIIETCIIDIPKARLKIDYNIRIENYDEVIVSGYTVHAFIDSSGKPKKIPTFILDQIIKHYSL